MFRVALSLAGLIIVVALLSVGCSGEESAEPESQPQAESESAERQESVQQVQVQQAEPQREAEQEAEQAESDERAEDREQPEPASEQADESVGAEVEQQEELQQSEEQTEPAQEAQQQADAEKTKLTLGGDRAATLLIPKGVDRSEPRMLILLLHGYGSHAREVDAYFQFSQWVDQSGFGLLIPNGTRDRNAAQFWNGTDECCDIFGAEPDDVGYLKSLIGEAREHAAFDQVYAVGHSNGGFMAYRLACEEVPGLAGIVSLAGGAYSEAEQCRAPTPLSVLQIHGTEDALVLYESGRLPTHPDPERKPVPGAWASVSRWAERAGCDGSAIEELAPIDTDSAVEGDETTIKRYATGCVNQTVMELWTIEGGGHIPLVWETDFTPGILKWISERYAQAEEAALQVQERVLGGERTARLLYPPGTGDEAIPLVVSLHGYSGEADAHDWYFGLSERVLEYGFALITPQGTTDSRGNAFWNATEACCNFEGSEVDDYGWISGLVEEAGEVVEISGVHVVGYSNGGFMAYRLACDGLEGLVSIVSLAGSSFGDPGRCEGAAPVSVLQIHGSDDRDIPYAGTLEYEGGYPGAEALVDRWSERAGCEVEADEELPSLDLEATLAGAETSVRRYREGCGDGITVELWTIEGGDHFPLFTDGWPDQLLNWVLNESRTN